MAFTTYGKRRVYKPKFKIANKNRRAQVTNKSVMKEMKAPPKKERTVDGRQTNAITTLSKQVRSLQLEKYGLVQNNRQLAIFRPNPNIAEGQFPTTAKPIAFLMQNLEREGRVYEGTQQETAPGSNVYNAGYTTTTSFTVPQQVGALANQWQWNRHDRNNTTDIRVGYLPLARYFEIRTSITPTPAMNLKPARINIKLIKMRPQNYRTQSTTLTYNLPNALGAYRNLLVRPTVTNNFTRNYLNKEIHEVLYNKDIWITPKNQASFNSVDSENPLAPNEKTYCYTHRFKYTFKPKFIKSAVDLPEEDATAMWSHVPTHDQVWCLISSDSEADYLNELRAAMSISCHNYWRDNIGTEGV